MDKSAEKEENLKKKDLPVKIVDVFQQLKCVKGRNNGKARGDTQWQTGVQRLF